MKLALFRTLASFLGSCLLFLNIQLSLSWSLVGNVLTDLTGTDATSFGNDANLWTLSKYFNPYTKVYKCGSTYLLGGYAILGGTLNEYFQRTYTGLPNHNIMNVFFMFYAIDSWDGADGGYNGGLDHFEMAFDGVTKYAWRLSAFDGYATQVCGLEVFAEYPAIQVYVDVPHSGTSLTIKIISMLDEPADNESFGFRDIKITFANVASPTYALCGIANNSPLPDKMCSCTDPNMYMDPPSSGHCLYCHPSCKTCSWGTADNCTSCATGQYLINGKTCVSTCNSPLVSATTNVTTCSTPCPGTGSYAYWDKSCDSCVAPLKIQTSNTFNLCTYPCAITGEYLYWNGSCKATCASPLSKRDYKGRNFCDYPCTGSNILYWNTSCKAACPSPLTTRFEADKYYCDYPCADSEYLYWNGSCKAACVLPLKSRVEADKNYCDYPCTSGYLYWNGSCKASCPTPLKTRNEATKDYCDYPCTGSDVLYWNTSCKPSCPFPLTTRFEADKYYCDYPCSSGYLYWNGSCKASCPTPLKTRNEATKDYCDYPCTGSDILYWNTSCKASCPFPLTTRFEADKYYCDYPCSSGYLYWNGSCKASCPSPLKTRNEATKDYCDYPCTGSDILYWNTSCKPSCPYPLSTRFEADKYYCDYLCKDNEYLFFNTSCLTSCPAPLHTREEASKNYCDYPCTGTDVLYWNGSCEASCNFPLSPREEATKDYCDYPCKVSEVLYFNGSCKTSCPKPLSTRQEASRNYCDYPCTGTQTLRWDGICIASCDFPLHPRQEATKDYCDYPCQLNEHLYWNGSCFSNCVFPLSKRNEADRDFCDYPCEGAEYLFWNGTCAKCTVPFSSRISYGDRYCDYPCDTTETLYWDGMCAENCAAPALAKTEGNPMVRNYCTFQCKINEFLYWNGSCSSSCKFPLTNKIQNSRLFCIYPCDTDQYLYWNGSCKASCDVPFTTRREHLRNYCDYPCDSSEYLYWNGTCLPTCETPLSPRIEGKDKFCDYSCNAEEYLYWNGECLSDCVSPLSPATLGTVLSRKFCFFGCQTSESLYWDKTCSSDCDAPLVELRQHERRFCQYPCQREEYLYWNGSCKSSCDFPLVHREANDRNYCDFECSESEYLYWNGTCLPHCDFPLSQRLENRKRYCDFSCQSEEYLYFNGSCIKECQIPFTPKIEGTYTKKNFCTVDCQPGEFLHWNGSCLASCDSPFNKIVDGSYNFCHLPCNNLLLYYYLESGSCDQECSPPHIINLKNIYPQCLPPAPVEATATLFNMFLDAPLHSGTLTVVKVVKAMQYLRYLDIKLPPRLERLGVSRGRNVAAMGSGARVLNEAQAHLVKQALPSVFNKHNFQSSFLDNFWDTLMFLGAALASALICYLFEKVAQKAGWELMESIFMRLRVITKWNLFLMMLATSIDDIILYSSVEFRTVQISSSSAISDHLGIVLCVVFLTASLLLMILSFYIVEKLQRLKMNILPESHYRGNLIQEFHLKWQDFQVMFRGLKDNNTLSQYFFLLYTLRIGLPMLVTVCATSLPLLIICFQLLVNCSVLIFMLKMKPFKKRINQIQLVCYELVVLMMNTCILVLVIFNQAGIENEHASVILGDIVILGNDILNILTIPFVLIKLKQEFDVIRKLQKIHPKGKARYLQLLSLVFQQANMGFEELIEEDPKLSTSVVKPRLETSEKEQETNTRELMKQKVKYPRRTVVPFDHKSNEENYDNSDKASLVYMKKGETTNLDITDGQPTHTSEDFLAKPLRRIRPRLAKKSGDGNLNLQRQESDTVDSEFSPTASPTLNHMRFSSEKKDNDDLSQNADSPTSYKHHIRKLLQARSIKKSQIQD